MTSARIGFLVCGLFFLIMPFYRLLRTSTHHIERIGLGLFALSGVTSLALAAFEFPASVWSKLLVINAVLSGSGVIAVALGVRRRYPAKPSIDSEIAPSS